MMLHNKFNNQIERRIMSKLVRWIVLTITISIVVGILSYVLSAFGMTGTSSSITYNAGGIVCLVFMCVACFCEIVGTLSIWTRKNVPDITVDRPSSFASSKKSAKAR